MRLNRSRSRLGENSDPAAIFGLALPLSNDNVFMSSRHTDMNRAAEPRPAPSGAA